MNRLFDQQLLDQRRQKALARGDRHATFLLEAAVTELIERLAAVKRHFPIAVDLSTPTSLLADRLAASGQVGRVLRADRLVGSLGDGDYWSLAFDGTTLPLAAESVDLIVSALALQFVEDLPGLLAQARRALKPDGLLFVTFLGGDTLTELRDAFTRAEIEIRGGASPRIMPFITLRDAGALMQRAGFALPVVDQDRLTVRFPGALELMRDLQAMGAANALLARDRRPLTRSVLARVLANYAESYGDPDGKVRATFQIISLSGWAPDVSQQQPLKPGSAKMRLAEALKPSSLPREPTR